MKQTENYQLCQWEKTDRILMEDFNADNVKIDAALYGGLRRLEEQIAAVDARVSAERRAWEGALAAERSARQAGDRLVTLLDVTTTAAAQQVDLAVKQIDFTQYLAVAFHVEFPAAALSLPMGLRVNGADGYTAWPTSGSYNSNASGPATVLASFSNNRGGITVLPGAGAEGYVTCLCVSGDSHGVFGHYTTSGVKWTRVETLQLVTTDEYGRSIEAGTHIWLTGVRK